jgi:hypothetical protein
MLIRSSRVFGSAVTCACARQSAASLRRSSSLSNAINSGRANMSDAEDWFHTMRAVLRLGPQAPGLEAIAHHYVGHFGIVPGRP